MKIKKNVSNVPSHTALWSHPVNNLSLLEDHQQSWRGHNFYPRLHAGILRLLKKKITQTFAA